MSEQQLDIYGNTIPLENMRTGDKCKHCHGDGERDGMRCLNCHGTGLAQAPYDPATVEIPY